MQNFIPLIAAGGDAVSIIIAIIVIGSLVVRALSAVFGGANKPQQPVRPRGQAAGRPADNKPLRAEVEEFLRRAKSGELSKPQSPQRSPAPVVQAQVIEAEVLESPRGESVASHVERHISREPVSDHAMDLGREVGLADEHLESHLQQVFAHDLGNFPAGNERSAAAISQGTDADVWKMESPDLEKKAAEPTLASSIVSMFRQPQDVRKAIVLSEILNPPEHRWD